MKVRLVVALALVSPPTGAGKDGGEQAFQENCGLCHSLDRPRSKRMTRTEWERIMERMIGFGCPIDSSRKKWEVAVEILDEQDHVR